jgi:hypothetical protein
MRRMPVIGVPRSGSETAPRPELEPIFAELACEWGRAGRSVAGRMDEEWAILVRRCPWPTR